MVFVRQTIVSDASLALARAVCIATRYSAVRRQFGSKKGSLETQVSCKVVTGICICSYAVCYFSMLILSINATGIQSSFFIKTNVEGKTI